MCNRLSELRAQSVCPGSRAVRLGLGFFRNGFHMKCTKDNRQECKAERLFDSVAVQLLTVKWEARRGRRNKGRARRQGKQEKFFEEEKTM